MTRNTKLKTQKVQKRIFEKTIEQEEVRPTPPFTLLPLLNQKIYGFNGKNAPIVLKSPKCVKEMFCGQRAEPFK